jgi:hypothetical protein
MTWKELMPLYQTMVKNYTERSLTYNSDVPRALARLLPVSQKLEGSKFIHELPLAMLAPSLLWVHCKSRLNSHGKTEHPTWTLADWEGALTYPKILSESAKFDATVPEMRVKEWQSTVGGLV